MAKPKAKLKMFRHYDYKHESSPEAALHKDVLDFLNQLGPSRLISMTGHEGFWKNNRYDKDKDCHYEGSIHVYYWSEIPSIHREYDE